MDLKSAIVYVGVRLFSSVILLALFGEMFRYLGTGKFSAIGLLLLAVIVPGPVELVAGVGCLWNGTDSW